MPLRTKKKPPGAVIFDSHSHLYLPSPSAAISELSPHQKDPALPSDARHFILLDFDHFSLQGFHDPLHVSLDSCTPLAISYVSTVLAFYHMLMQVIYVLPGRHLTQSEP